MEGKITFLVDNKANAPLVAEHGLSILLEVKGKRILFDTGQATALFTNAEHLGVSLSSLDALILSHGHYDHGGNVAKVLTQNPMLDVFAHPGCLAPRWTMEPGEKPRSIALSGRDAAAMEDHFSIHWCNFETEVIPGVWLTGSIGRMNDYEDVGGPFYLDQLGERADFLTDDMALWMEGEKGATVICGCCHSGIKNTLEQICSFSGNCTIHTLAGGLHLLQADEDRLEKTVSFFNETGIKRIIPAHCTGDTATEVLKTQCRAKVQPAFAGLQIVI